MYNSISNTQLPLWASSKWRQIKIKKLNENNVSLGEMPLWVSKLWRKRMLKKFINR